MDHDPHCACNDVGDIASKLAALAGEALFADVWSRAGQGPRERSIATLATLVALSRIAQLPLHFARARGNGVDDDGLIEPVTHRAFYAGWSGASSAIGVLHGERAA